ncbi:hypothetical protein COBT_003703 [Conglomerata obtusa]
MHLTGIAFKFYDELKTKPIVRASFREKMENRFGASKLDKPTLMLKTLSRKQQKNEPTKKFIEEIFKLGEMAGMTEDLLVQTIIGNLKTDKKIFYKCLLKRHTLKDLNNLVDTIETESIEEDYNNNKNDYDDSDDNNDNENNKTINELTEKIQKMDLKIQNLTKHKQKNYLNIPMTCNICKKTGHVARECLSNKNFEQNNNN